MELGAISVVILEESLWWRGFYSAEGDDVIQIRIVVAAAAERECKMSSAVTRSASPPLALLMHCAPSSAVHIYKSLFGLSHSPFSLHFNTAKFYLDCWKALSVICCLFCFKHKDLWWWWRKRRWRGRYYRLFLMGRTAYCQNVLFATDRESVHLNVHSSLNLNWVKSSRFKRWYKIDKELSLHCMLLLILIECTN